MDTRTAPTTRPFRTPALVGGVALLAMAVLAGWANLAVVEELLTPGDAARTAQDVLASAATFRLGVTSFAIVAVLDVVVAWALWAFYAPVDRVLSAAAATVRVVYAGVFGVAIVRLAGVLSALEGAGGDAAGGQALALERAASFHQLWDAGLVLFGLHLVLVGWLAIRSGYTPRWLGALVVVAGVGYGWDSVGALVSPGTLPEVAVFTFVGEILLLGWLLVRGRTAHPATSAAVPVPA